MIIDSLDNASKYFAVHPLFEKAFTYIKNVNPLAVEPGKCDIEGENLRAIFSNKPGMSAAESIQKFECHDKHIDIQFCISGRETIGWKPRGSCLAPKGEYNPEKDVQLYNDAPDTYFTLTDGQFAIFFPEDVHAPMIAVNEDPIKKIVIKVKI
jgi:biofilm protein TabA